MERTEAIERVKSVLTKNRYEHTLRVTKEAIRLAKLFNVSEEEAELAAILHDFAKNFPVQKLKQKITDGSLPKDLLHYDVELWHGPVAAILLEDDHGVDDGNIINAVRYHTTGRANMSDLELVVYLADYIEPGRDFPGLKEVREIANEDLLYACWMVSRNTIQFLMQKKIMIYPDTFYAYNDLTKRISNNMKNDKS